jgi:hypothetical protein
MTKPADVDKQNPALKKVIDKELGIESENAFLSFFSKFGSTILIALTVLVVGVFFIVRYYNQNFNQKMGSSLTDYYQARSAYAKLVKQTEIEAGLITQVEQLMKKHPEIAPKYEGLLAQTLLNQDNSTNLPNYTAPLFKRMDESLSPTFKEYAAISVLVAEKKYEEALERTQQLDQELTSEGDTFYLPLFNLLRQAALAEQLGNKELELKTWQEWQLRTAADETQALMKEIFQEGLVSISDYIKFRLQLLEPVQNPQVK